MRWIVALALWSVAGWAAAQSPRPAPPAAVAAPAPDYTADAAWLCRPGRADSCSGDLDAVRVDAAGARTPAPFRPDPAAPVDCFYVYPTVSHQAGDYADGRLTADEAFVARQQAARFGSVCRVYAPLYRSGTVTGLMASLRPGGPPRASSDEPYADVKAAWRRYLEHDNQGRGVVLIGHSQGSNLLKRLLAGEIDGRPAQARLVSALLAGPRLFTVKAGGDRGGTLQSIPLCRAPGQTGCVVVWSTYAEGDASAPRVFEPPPGGGLESVCVNPAAPQGGRGLLKADLSRPSMAPPSDPPFVEAVGQMSAECVHDADGAVLRVRVEPGRYADLLKALEGAYSRLPGWGLHLVDVNFTAGNLRDLIRAQSQAWLARRR